MNDIEFAHSVSSRLGAVYELLTIRWIWLVVKDLRFEFRFCAHGDRP
jgi:hypothetical protein